MYLDFNQGWKYKSGNEWMEVTLPHDAMIDSDRSAEAAGGGAAPTLTGEFMNMRRNLTVLPNGRKNPFILFLRVFTEMPSSD